MDCSAIEPLLTRHADDELDERQRALVDEHLAACAPCRSEAESLRAENEAYTAALPSTPAPEGLQEAVMARIRTADGQPLWQRWRLPPLVATLRVSPALSVAVALLVLVVFGLPAMLQTSGRQRRAAVLGGAAREFAASGEKAAPEEAQQYVDRLRAAAGAAASSTPSRDTTEVRQSVAGTPAAPAGGDMIYAGAAGEDNLTQLAPYGRASDAGAPVTLGVEGVRARDAAKWVSRQNAYMVAPAPVTEAEVADNVVLQRRFALVTPRGEVYDWVPGERLRSGKTSAAPAPVGGYSEQQGGQRPITPEATKATVTLAVYYKELPTEPAPGRSWATTYQAQFDGSYAIRAPQSKRKGVRIELTFPFPPSASTIQDAQLTVDGSEDGRKTTYSLAGVRWAGWFQPEERRTIRVAYRAHGKGDYIYALPKDTICQALDFAITVHNLQPGARPELAAESLPASVAPLERDDPNEFRWTYSNTITRRDIVLHLPPKTAVTPMLERVAQYTDEILPLCQYAPLLLALFLGGVIATTRPARGRLRLDALTLLAIAFLAFFPLYMFSAAYLEPPRAFGVSLAVLLAVTTAYAALTSGWRWAVVVGFFGAVCLGAFGYALIKPELRGLIFTGGGLLILLWFMALSALRARAPTASPPADGP